jgi:hypothetical protein
MNVRIINRTDREHELHRQVGGQVNTTTQGTASCYSGTCNGSSTTAGNISAARILTYDVSGATLSLLLPDGRVAVVNCDSKMQFIGPRYRSCRVPMADHVQAEFKGKNAKLSWPVSIDGKKMESETYTVLGVTGGE